jgi:hypothetical protein
MTSHFCCCPPGNRRHLHKERTRGLISLALLFVQRSKLSPREGCWELQIAGWHSLREGQILLGSATQITALHI